jgi:segregation and condensation protein B
MQNGQETIPFDAATAEAKNLFPGAVAFVETFDTDDAAEPADTLSFASLRDAFATIQSAETELAQTIPDIECSTEEKPCLPEQPDYEMDDADDWEEEDVLFSSHSTPNIGTPVTVGAVTTGARLETIIEAMLFVGNRESQAFASEQIAEKLRNVSSEEVDQAVAHLNKHYQERNCPYTIISERGGYRMILRSEFEPVRANFYGKIRETRLSQQAIDTLAVVAYRQPITAEEIQNIRQQPCAAVLNQLVRRNLLRISREVKGKKNIVRYHITSRFLELCQIQSREDIPKIDELDCR